MVTFYCRYVAGGMTVRYFSKIGTESPSDCEWMVPGTYEHEL